MASDHDDQQRLAGALRAERARLQAAIESLPFDFWMIDNSGHYVMQNSPCRHHWGDVVGRRPEDVAEDSATREVWLHNNRRAFAGETVREEVRYPINGALRDLYNVVSPILDQGRTIGILGINLDITERKRAERGLRRRNEELERLSKAKDQLTAMISHELRNPLVTGLGYIDMLLEGALGDISDRIRSRFSVAQRNLRRLAQLIDAVLKYQRVLTAGGGLAKQALPFDLAAVTREVVDEIKTETRNGVRLSVEIDPALPAVRGDRELIRMVMANLIGNALSHAGAGAAIRVILSRTPTTRSEATTQDVRAEVIDTGTGVPSAIRDTVFEPFVRGDETQAGSGLGLSIVRAILSAHESQVSLDSQEGAGTRVSFLLPAG